MDDSDLNTLAEINDALVEHLKYLLEKKDLEALSKLIPIVDRLTVALIKMHEKKTSQ